MEFLPQWLTDLTPGTLLGVVVLMLITGKGLASRREVDAAEKRAETYRVALETALTALKESTEHDAELIENSRTTVRVLEVLQAARSEQIQRLSVVREEPPRGEATS
ncbi:hypothetical protein [Isoptericola sp. NPDC055881]